MNRLRVGTLVGIFLVVLTLVAASPFTTATSAATFTIKNNCSYTVYPGVYPPTFRNGGWSQAAGATVSFSVNAGWIGRIWPRRGCDGSSPAKCATGSCGGTGLQCAGTTGQPNVSLFEANINASGTDWYDVSYVDAVNVPVGLKISNVNCSSPTKCSGPIAQCPADLKSGNACLSPCTKYNTDQYCCRGAFGTPSTCVVANWAASAKAYINNIHNGCPADYAYAYDDTRGLHTCPSNNNTYTITFCP